MFFYRANLFFVVILLVIVLGLSVIRKLNFYGHNRTYKIALLTRNASFAQQVTEGIMTEVEAHPEIKYDIRSFYAPGRDALSQQSLAEEAIADNPDIILSLGVAFIQVALNAMNKRKSTAPFIFAGSGDPVTQGLVTSVGPRTEQITGVLIGRVDYNEPINLLLKCKPTVKNVLIPHFPASLLGMVEQAAIDVKELCKKRGVNVYLVPLDVRSDIAAMIAPFMNKVDTVMCIEGDRIDDYNALLVKLCESHGVTLFAKEIESVRDGAALGFGTYAKSIGVMMMQYARKVLTGQAKASQLPVCSLDGARILVLNKAAAAKQDLPITQELLSLVDRVY